MKRIIAIVLLPVLMLTLTGCAALNALTKVGTAVGVATGTLTAQQADSINKTSDATTKAFESLTPENEYYIGRAVAATILKTYKPLNNDAANHYVNVIGQSLAMVSDKPETFGGYHFLIMDSDEINAFAAPGGLILVSRGLLRCCKNEDAVAAVLAHEVAHVQYGHGMQAIKKGRFTSAVTTALAEAGKSLGGQQLAELTTAFEGTISDITSTMVNDGYSRKFEIQSDAGAVTIMTRLGYNPAALADMLREMDRLVKPGGHGFGKTHPDPKDRIKNIEPLVRESGPASTNSAKQERFQKAMAGI